MKLKVYIFGLCDVFYDGYYIQGLYETFDNVEFNISKFPSLRQGTFAFIIESNTDIIKKIIIDSKDSNEIDQFALDWCNLYGKVNYNEKKSKVGYTNKVIPIGPSFGVRIWSFFETTVFMIVNFFRFKKSILNKREFIANYWRQYQRFSLKEYVNKSESSNDEVFFINSIWKQEPQTNTNRSLFITACKNNTKIHFEGGFVARKDGNNLGFENFVYSKRIPLRQYLGKIKKSAIVFNTPAVLSCHGWKLAEFLALGKAIISTDNYNEMPSDLINGEHLIYASNYSQIEEAIEKILTDIAFKNKLEVNSRKYFDNYLTPKMVVSRLLDV